MDGMNHPNEFEAAWCGIEMKLMPTVERYRTRAEARALLAKVCQECQKYAYPLGSKQPYRVWLFRLADSFIVESLVLNPAEAEASTPAGFPAIHSVAEVGDEPCEQKLDSARPSLESLYAPWFEERAHELYQFAHIIVTRRLQAPFDAEDAEDLALGAVAHCYTKLIAGKYNKGNFYAWYRQLVIHFCSDAQKHRRDIHLTFDESIEFDSTDAANAFAAVEEQSRQEEVRLALEEAFESLSPPDRIVLHLKYVGEMTARQMAECLSQSSNEPITENTIAMRLHHAKIKARAVITKLHPGLADELNQFLSNETRGRKKKTIL